VQLGPTEVFVIFDSAHFELTTRGDRRSKSMSNVSPLRLVLARGVIKRILLVADFPA
jgi:hypothetical protein